MRQKMGMVFQHFNLFPHLTILENMTLAPVQLKLKTKSEADSENAMALLERVGLEDKADAYPLSALRRPEAAHRHCPGPGHAAGCHAL